MNAVFCKKVQKIAVTIVWYCKLECGTSMVTNEQVEQFKIAAFQDMEQNIDQLATIYVRDTINNAFKNNMLRTKKKFESLKNEFENPISSMSIEQIYEEAVSEFSKITTGKIMINIWKKQM